MSSMRKSDKQLHVAMFPWLAFGHILPFFELAKVLAHKGQVRITFISTPGNINRLPKIPRHIEPFITLVSLPFLHEHKASLPENGESTMDVPIDKAAELIMAYEGLQESLAQLLKSSAPNWILFDFIGHWIPPLAKSLNIPCAFFCIFPALDTCFFHIPKSHLGNPASFRTKIEDFFGPPKWVPFPSNIGLKFHEVKKIFGGPHFAQNDHEDTILTCDLFVYRSCTEFESEWLNLVGELHNKPVIPVGVIPPTLQVRDADEEDKNPMWANIKSWLDKQRHGSVVYVAFGSEIKIPQEDITEMALGLELSGFPFFWVIRKQQLSLTDLPNGFEDRTKDRGIVCKDWVPQLKILAHESVGAYFTHCGAGSILEGLNFGRVLVTLPFYVDQSLHARVLEEKKVGVEIPRNEQDGSFTRTSVAKSLMLAMVDEEGSIYRDKAKEMGLLFSDSHIQERYIENFIEYLQNYKLKN
ncbi:UDP-glycosyltransferase [Quillaja saponaria]|uniref:UDP-glycosyltransferase n=1 Tax=Quillaja saponaria TaxID=32244 RepID=A0AAD7LVG4_QUISA|nr:UDP-glycosyltransferase [Quillaja saponaria]